MTDTITLPQTPAEVAAAVLAEIEASPSQFLMSHWMYVPSGDEDPTMIPAGEPPMCDSTMCAAGWAAHVTGWNLIDNPAGCTVPYVSERGVAHQLFVGVWAEKNGERRLIWEVAREALGLTDAETFWSHPENEVIERLRAIASRT